MTSVSQLISFKSMVNSGALSSRKTVMEKEMAGNKNVADDSVPEASWTDVNKCVTPGMRFICDDIDAVYIR